MKKKAIALILAAVMVFSLCSCGNKQSERKQNNEIVIGIGQDLGDSLNPYQMTAAGTKEIMTNVYEGLYKVMPSGEYVQALVDKTDISEGGKVYKFTLKDGVKFHNGKIMTVDDVLYSFETCKNITVDSSLPGILNDAQIVGEGNTVTITLPAANNDFFAYLSLVYIIPEGSSDEVVTAPIGTGPYKFVSRSVQENIVFEKFDEYWGTPADIKKITCNIYENSTAMIAALNAGAIDIAAHLTLDQVKGLGDDYNIVEDTMKLVQALYLNNAREPFNDVRIRQAICYAIDVDEILQLTAEGHGAKLGTSIYPAFGKYFDESLVGKYPHSVEKAKELMAEAGYPDGFSMSVTVPSNYTPHVNVGQVVVRQLNDAGIKAELKEVEWNSWLKDVYQGRDFDSTISGFDASVLTANALLQRWVSTNGKNMIGFSNEEYDALISKATAETDDAVRTQLYKDAAAILSEYAANAYIQDLPEYVAINKDLSGYTFYPLYKIDFSPIHY